MSILPFTSSASVSIFGVIGWWLCPKGWAPTELCRLKETIDGTEIDGFVMHRRGPDYSIEYRACTSEELTEARWSIFIR
jgi:hypothetical protein